MQAKNFTGTGHFRIGLIGYALVSCEWEFFINCVKYVQVESDVNSSMHGVL